MDLLARDRPLPEALAAAFDREPHARSRITAKHLRDALLLRLEGRHAVEDLRDRLAFDRGYHVVRLQARFVRRTVEDHVLDAQQVRLLVAAVGEADAAG